VFSLLVWALADTGFLCTAPAPGGFGAPPASGGLFGSSAPAPSQGFFGAPAPAPPPQNYYGGGYPPTSSIIPPAADAVLAQQLAAVANQRKELEKLDVWRGQSPQQSSIIPTSMSESEAALRVSPYSTSSGMSTYRASPKSAAKIRPRGFGAAHGQATDTSTSVVLGQLGKSNSPMMSPGAMSSAKRLVIMPDAHTPKPSLRLRLTAATQESKTDHVLRLPSAMMSPPTQMNGLNLSTPKPLAAASPNMQQSPMTNTPKTQSIPGSSMENNITPANGAGFEFYRHVVGSPQASSNSGGAAIGHLAPKLTKPGYIVTPSLQELAKMSEVDLATVSGFSVSREGHGSVAWEGAVDVRGVDLDVVVNIGSKDVSVYEQQEQDGTKPAEGSKLNRPAIITIPKVWPKPGESATAEQMEKFRNKLKKSSQTMDAEFISYDEPTGEWMFRVRHFSKYGLMDDDDTDDDDDLAPQVVAAIAAETHQPQFFESGERGGRSQGKAGATFQQFGGSPTRFTVPTDDDDEFDEMMNYQNTDDDEIALLSDVETGTTEEQILQAANRAYASLLSPEPEPQDVGMAFDEEIDEDFYPGENIGVEPPSRPLPIPPSADKLLIHRSLGVCARIAQSRGVPLASETDFGLRMGRSFRVGWGPNGTFLHIRADGVIVQSRPVFSESQERAERMLEIHRQYSAKSLQGPEQLPFFQLTEGRIGASTLITALDSYANSIPTQTSDGSVVKQAFSLLSCLMQDKVVGISSETIMLTDDIETRQQANRTGGLEAFKRWMRDACSESAMVDVQKAEQRNDALGAVFATLTSGNLESATSIASKYGYHQLSALIAVGSTCANFVEDQVRQWQVAGNSKFIPVDILRVYTLLGGNMKLEEKLYTDGNRSIDWKRRLGMLFFYSFDNQGGIFDFAGVVETYQSSVDRGVAPGPQSEVSANDASCLLYRLLRIGNSIINGEQSFKYSISDLISPAGHASSSQDLSVSFHLAASLSAIGCCSPLSELEMARLYDGYASQLMSNGKWELAVYVMLCSIGDSNSQFDAWRCARAKQLVLSSYNTSLEHKRDFLVETVGLPKTWFAECSATRAAMRGDAFEFINHASFFAPNEARIALEEVVVPSLLFRNAKETLKSLELLGSYASGDETLTTCVLDFFHLCEGVMSVGDSAADRKENLLHSLVKTASDLEKRFALHKAQAENVSSGYKKFHGTPVPIKSFFAEVLAGLDFVKLQLGALQAGESIWNDAMDQIRYPVPMKLASQLIAMSKTTISDGVSPTDQQFRGII
jgi:nuclear pore complex protein Nup98-Nup96